jgi:MFS family permease
MGAAIGPLLAVAYLAWHPADYRALYFWAFIPGLLSVLCVFFLRESPTRGAPRAKKPLSLAWRLTPDFRRFLVAWGFFSVTNSSDIFLILKAKSSGLSLTQTILMYCAYNLSYAGLSPVLGHLSDARGRRTVLIGGLLVFAAVYTGFAVAHLQWEFWLLFIVYGFYNAATDGVSKAYAIDLMPDHLKGTTIGILGTVTGLATLVSSTTAGLIWEHVSSSAALIYGAAGALICVGFLLLWRPSGTIESTP